jgi:hypothetical protein
VLTVVAVEAELVQIAMNALSVVMPIPKNETAKTPLGRVQLLLEETA